MNTSIFFHGSIQNVYSSKSVFLAACEFYCKDKFRILDLFSRRLILPDFAKIYFPRFKMLMISRGVIFKTARYLIFMCSMIIAEGKRVFVWITHYALTDLVQNTDLQSHFHYANYVFYWETLISSKTGQTRIMVTRRRREAMVKLKIIKPC